MPQSNEFRIKRRAERRKNGLCTTCGKVPPAPGKIQCKQCQRYSETYRSKNRAAGHCTKCRRPPKPGWKQCERCLARARRYNSKLRDEVFAAYGGYECKCCGETQREFLQIDHIQNDGAEHRRKIGNTNLYGWLKRNNFPPGFQVLCANCNYAKGFYGYCPHHAPAAANEEFPGVQRSGRRKDRVPGDVYDAAR